MGELQVGMSAHYHIDHDAVTFTLHDVPRQIFKRILAACGTTALQEIVDGVEAQRVGMDLDIEQTRRVFTLKEGEW